MIIFAICGKSAVGKDTLSNRVSAHLKIKRIVSCTTRPMRKGEVDGVDYHFITPDLMAYYKREGETLNHTSYKIDQETIWEYTYLKKDVEECKKCIMILNPDGLKAITEYYKDNKKVKIVKILLDAPLEVRIGRSLHRNGNTEKAIIEIIRRGIADEEDFKGIEYDYIIDTSKNNAYRKLYGIIQRKLGNELLEATREMFRRDPKRFLGGR